MCHCFKRAVNRDHCYCSKTGIETISPTAIKVRKLYDNVHFSRGCRIACTVGLSRTGDEEEIVTKSSLHELYEAFFVAMNDYTIDSRGDVGAWYDNFLVVGKVTPNTFLCFTDVIL